MNLLISEDEAPNNLRPNSPFFISLHIDFITNMVKKGSNNLSLAE